MTEREKSEERILKFIHAMLIADTWNDPRNLMDIAVKLDREYRNQVSNYLKEIPN